MTDCRAPELGPVYRVRIRPLMSQQFPLIKKNPLAIAFRDWVYENDIMTIQGTLSGGMDQFVADFPMDEADRIEKWFDDNLDTYLT